MKKHLLLVLIAIFTFTSCDSSETSSSSVSSQTETTTIPNKIYSDSDVNGTYMNASPINPENLDDYLFLENVQYIDVRDLNTALKEGYVAGFELLPFFNFFANTFNSSNVTNALYHYTNKDENGQIIGVGTTGSFYPNYIESKDIIESFVSKEKYIFVMSATGEVSWYLLNLLVQLGYDKDKLYNVGGFTTSLFPLQSYKDAGNPKYIVKGYDIYPSDSNDKYQVDFDYIRNIHSINLIEYDYIDYK